jgi:hypothetical protein
VKKVQAPVEQPETLEDVIQRHFIDRVKQAVIEAGSVSRATRALRMDEHEIQALLDANP